MRIGLLASGAFALPTARALRAAHDVALVCSQPDRPAGRKRKPTPTPVSAWAQDEGLDLIRPRRLDADAVATILAAQPDALVVIAYGHLVPRTLTERVFSINLHGSLLPRWRGAAPIHRAILAGDRESGVSVIALAPKMDAGVVYATRSTPIDPGETAGELHDRLAELGPEAVLEVLGAYGRGEVGIGRGGTPQDETLVTHAAKLAKADGTVRFDRPADEVRRGVHGLVPWPGCTVRAGDGDDAERLRLERVRVVDGAPRDEAPGTVLEDGAIVCAPGLVAIQSVVPAGGRPMSIRSLLNGRPGLVGTVLHPVSAPAERRA